MSERRTWLRYNATEICCSSVLPLVSQHATKFLQHRFSSVRLSTHFILSILETVRTCGLIKTNSFTAKAYSHCYLMNLQTRLGRIAIYSLRECSMTLQFWLRWSTNIWFIYLTATDMITFVCHSWSNYQTCSIGMLILKRLTSHTEVEA